MLDIQTKMLGMLDIQTENTKKPTVMPSLTFEGNVLVLRVSCSIVMINSAYIRTFLGFILFKPMGCQESPNIVQNIHIYWTFKLSTWQTWGFSADIRFYCQKLGLKYGTFVVATGGDGNIDTRTYNLLFLAKIRLFGINRIIHHSKYLTEGKKCLAT